MRHLLVAMLLLVLPLVIAFADEDFDKILSFEVSQEEGAPHGWVGGPRDTLFVDDEIVHGGEWAGRIERDAGSERSFSTMTNSLPVEVSGTTLELRGFLRLEGVVEWAGLWLREDGEAGSVAFDNMQQRELRGTLDWTEYSIKLRRPCPSSGPVFLRAKVVDSNQSRAVVEATLEAGDQVCANCRGIFVAVKPGHPAYHRW